jgi:hypothetical protein
MAVIGVVFDGVSSGIEPTAPMLASSTVAAVDGSGIHGIFTTTYYNDDQHPYPHHSHPCPPLDKEGTAGWRAHRDASHLSLPCKSMVVCCSCLGVHGVDDHAKLRAKQRAQELSQPQGQPPATSPTCVSLVTWGPSQVVRIPQRIPPGSHQGMSKGSHKESTKDWRQSAAI